MRKPSCDAAQELAKLKNVIVVALDVTSETSIKDGVKAGLDKFGTIDALVNNAGYGLGGPLEFATLDQLNRQYNTNLIGSILVIQAVLPTMRAAKSGVIVNLTSVGGREVFPLNSLYHGSKFALEGVSEAAAIELVPFGIKVRLFEPGVVHTDFSGRSMVMTQSETVRHYDPIVANVLAKFGEVVNTGSKPLAIAKVIFEAVTSTSDKLRYLAGDDAHQMMSERNALSDEEYQKKLSERFDVRL